MDKRTTPFILKYLTPRNIKEKIDTLWDSLRSLTNIDGPRTDTLTDPPLSDSAYNYPLPTPFPRSRIGDCDTSWHENSSNYQLFLWNQLRRKKPLEYIVESSYPDIDLPAKTLRISEYMFQAFEKYGDRTALIDSLTHKSLTFSDLIRKSQRLADSLSLRSISQGHMAAIISSNTPDFLPIFLALNTLGATVTLVTPQSTKDELVYYLNETKTNTIFAQYSLVPLTRDATLQVPSFKQENLFVIEPLIESYASLIDENNNHFTPLNYPTSNSAVTDLCPKIFTVSDLCREKLAPSSEKVPTRTSTPNEAFKGHGEGTGMPAIIPFSSGTTGKPKGVMLSDHNILSNMLQSQIVISDTDYKVISGLLPFFHIYGFTVNLLNSLSLGNTIVTFSTIEPSIFLKGLEKFKVNFLFIVPTVAQFLNNYRHLHKFDLSNIKTVFNGAAKLPKSQAETFSKLFAQPVRIGQGYGMTEMSPVSHVMPLDSEYNESIGMVIPNTQCKIVDIDTKETLPPFKKGELCVKGPQIMIGYLNNVEATNDMIRDGWLHTGDIAYYNEEGSFFITDRMKELIKYKGFQVAPAEVESVLLSHPGIYDAVVIGVPDDKAGELPVAFIVPKDKNLTPPTINAYIADKLSSHKWLRGGIHFVPAIPKSASGKTLRKDIKAMAMEKPPKTLYFKYTGH